MKRLLMMTYIDNKMIIINKDIIKYFIIDII